jgi:hypothetical protein
LAGADAYRQKERLAPRELREVLRRAIERGHKPEDDPAARAVRSFPGARVRPPTGTH